MQLKDTLASVKIDGKKLLLPKGETVVQNLKFTVELENKTGNLYSWVVYLENLSNERSPRITEFLGLDLALPIQGRAKFNTLRGDDCSIHSFMPESIDLVSGSTLCRKPWGARPSSTSAFPYFDVVDEVGDGFDFVFLDCNKSKYKDLYPKIKKILVKGGIIFADNVLFRGYITGEVKAPHRHNTIKNNMREYLRLISEDADFITTVFDVGDGISISYKK